jgi:MSHA biogenesis protein MshN
MSLINKMLQDLDARGTPAADSMPSQIRPVAPTRAALADRVDARTVSIAVAGAAAVGAVAAMAWFGWGHVRNAADGGKPAAVAAAAAHAPAATAATAAAPGQGMSSTITIGPAQVSVPAPVQAAAPAAAPAAVEPSASVSQPASAAAQRAPVQKTAPARAAAADDRFDAPPTSAPNKALAAAPKSVAGYEPDSDEARAARQAIMAQLQARMAPAARPPAIAHESKRDAARRKLAEAREAKAAQRANDAAAADTAAASAKAKRSSPGREESGTQRAEGEYRRALALLQDGRMSDSVAALEQVLRTDPAHDAARQTLVGLLIESKRNDEAIRQLQAGLALDPRQPALAMLLARLQIERGGAAIETLMRSLPYAGNNADYRAFLAGALQREQRNREAAEQYQAALRVAPNNGVWWMGLGMSLQAEKRNAEALEAFQRARASGMLSAELQAFVERRLQQLGR